MTRTGAALGCFLLLSCGLRAGEPLDSVMYRDPTFPRPKVERAFSDKLPGLWLDALDRPEADYRCQAALAIARAHEQGMTGLKATVPALTREVERDRQHPAVALAVSKALVALDAKEAAPGLLKLAAGDLELAEVIDPALAKWDHLPARDVWLKRLAQAPPRRGAVLAMQCLAVVREEQAVPRLRELALSAETPAAARLEAARALGAIRARGGEADADLLAADATPKGLLGRLAAVRLLRHHSGAETVRRLQAFVTDAEPSVAAVAVARLVELDPALVEPVLGAVLASTDPNVRTFGVEVLSRRPSEEHVRFLAARLSDAHPGVRSRARVALREQAQGALLEPVLREGERALAGSDWRGQEQAAVLLAQLAHKPAAARLVELLPSTRPEVAVAASWGLRVLAVPATYPRALDYLQKALKPEPPEWRDVQLSHLIQLLGEGKYVPADAGLRALVPAGAPAGPETRAAACWALGLLHEGKPLPELTKAFAGRLMAVVPGDLEDDRVRRMCAVGLGRLGGKEGLPALRKFYTGSPTLDNVRNACGWAVERITGEKVPPAGVVRVPQIGWFLVPVD